MNDGVRQRVVCLSILFLFVFGVVVGCGDDAMESGLCGGAGGGEVFLSVQVQLEGLKFCANVEWDQFKVHFLGVENDFGTGFICGTINMIWDFFEL